jgi:thioredoxin-like negative regulator of GroEL
MPTTLLFRDGVLVDSKLGAQTFEQLRTWIEGSAAGSSGK